MTGCIFCGIVEGTLPASVLHRDDLTATFLDIRPVNPGHLLVVPLRHATYLADLPVETGLRLFEIGQRMAGALKQTGVRCEGVNLFLADGEAAGQEIFHVHLHVIPRWKGDGFRIRVESGDRNPTREALDGIAERFRHALEGAKP